MRAKMAVGSLPDFLTGGRAGLAVPRRVLRAARILTAALVSVGLALAVGVLAPSAHADSAFDIFYKGDNPDGHAGVITGPPKVYMIVWGSQWGSANIDANNDVVFSNDPDGAAPALQGFFKGLGGAGDTWSTVMSQYCQGVPVGTQTCPAGTARVGVPTGSQGALGGVWVDATAPAPQVASEGQLAAEAVRAAQHFNNLTPSANGNAIYMVLSPTGTYPNGFPSSTAGCAQHNWAGNGSHWGPSPYGTLAIMNIPYDSEYSGCTNRYPSYGGHAGGFTSIASHEYAEVLTDPWFGGWANQQDGNEIGDKCMDYSFPLQLSTGLFWVQSVWSNAANNGVGGCIAQDPGPGVINGDFGQGTLAWATRGSVSTAAGLGIQLDAGSSEANQHFTVSPGENWLSFQFKHSCPATPLYTGAPFVTLEDYSATGDGMGFGKAGPIIQVVPYACAATDWEEIVTPVVPGHLYVLRFANYDQTSTAWFRDVALSTTNPVLAPTGLSVTQAGYLLYLNWTDTQSVASYNVYLSGNLVASGITGTTWTDPTPVGPGSPARVYTVRAVADSYLSPASDPATWVDPNAPTGLTVTQGTSRLVPELDLTWQPVLGANSYTVYRDGVQMPTGLLTGNSWADKTVTANTDYTYTVTAVVGGVGSGQSLWATGQWTPWTSGGGGGGKCTRTTCF